MIHYGHCTKASTVSIIISPQIILKTKKLQDDQNHLFLSDLLVHCKDCSIQLVVDLGKGRSFIWILYHADILCGDLADLSLCWCAQTESSISMSGRVYMVRVESDSLPRLLGSTRWKYVGKYTSISIWPHLHKMTRTLNFILFT